MFTLLSIALLKKNKNVRILEHKLRFYCQKMSEQSLCWFCQCDTGPMLFSWEFDTFIHDQCIRDALRCDSNHMEAQIMSNELSVVTECIPSPCLE